MANGRLNNLILVSAVCISVGVTSMVWSVLIGMSDRVFVLRASESQDRVSIIRATEGFELTDGEPPPVLLVDQDQGNEVYEYRISRVGVRRPDGLIDFNGD